MKFRKLLVLSTVMGLIFSAQAAASELCPGEQGQIAAEGSPVRKLQRGFLNVALSPIDLTTEFQKEQTRETFPPSWALAAGRGGCYAVGRALTGVYEMVTFLIPYPARYEPVIYPEFAWQKLPQDPPQKK
ncbi:MAG: hypothetical protein WC352_08565 [Candidatus Omnitrophota bacterium]|jgi:putative exosortase-associated protein (TIGR04073 family)